MPILKHLLHCCGTAALLSATTADEHAAPAAFGTTCQPSELRQPPRGWNSYDSSPPWGPPPLGMEASTEAQTLKDAASLAAELLPHGYDMLTLDSGWFGEDNLYGAQTIDAHGRLVPNTTQVWASTLQDWVSLLF